MFIWSTAFLLSFCIVFSIVMLNVFARCRDHAPFLNLLNVILKNLCMFNVNLFFHLHSFFCLFFLSDCRVFCVQKAEAK